MNTLEDRCNAIEECYEFMLAFAAQGLTTEAGGGKGAQVRSFLQRALEAIQGLAAAYGAALNQTGAEDAYAAFLAVLDRDAKDSEAAIRLVLAQPMISSQLIDNLNASIHLRALLTDLFLIDEIAKLQKAPSPAAAS